MKKKDELLKIRGLKIEANLEYDRRSRIVHGVDLTLHRGEEVEEADTETMLSSPQEDYTKSLWSVRSFEREPLAEPACRLLQGAFRHKPEKTGRRTARYD